MCVVQTGQTGWRSPPVPPHCPHIGRINLAPPLLLAGGAPAAATCSQSVRSYPPATGVTMALGCAGSILTLQPSGDAGSPHTSARGGEEAWSYSQMCSPRCLGPHPSCHCVIWCSGTCLAHPPAATTTVVVVLPHEPVCVLDMHMASVRAAETIRRSALSPALWLLMAVTPQPHQGDAGIPPRGLLLPRCRQQSWGWAQSRACACRLAGGEDAGLVLRDTLRAWRCCSSSLPTLPEALQQPPRDVGWQNHISSACGD